LQEAVEVVEYFLRIFSCRKLNYKLHQRQWDSFTTS